MFQTEAWTRRGGKREAEADQSKISVCARNLECIFLFLCCMLPVFVLVDVDRVFCECVCGAVLSFVWSLSAPLVCVGNTVRGETAGRGGFFLCLN